jgi:hypothetical protein
MVDAASGCSARALITNGSMTARKKKDRQRLI